MRMTAAMSSWTWLVGHLKERGLSLAGISCAMVRIALEQGASRTAGQFGHELASLVAHTPAERLELVVSVVGGPVWAGVDPHERDVSGPPMAGGPLAAVLARRLLFRCLPAAHGGQHRWWGFLPPAMPGRPSIRDAGRVTLSVLIVDDSQAFREISRRLLERQGLEVVGTAETLAEAVTKVAALRPRVALVDINLARESGFDVARQIARSDLDARYGGHPHVDPFRE